MNSASPIAVPGTDRSRRIEVENSHSRRSTAALP